MKARWRMAVLAGAIAAGCGPKTVPVDVPAGYADAKQATLQEVVDLVNGRYANVDNLTVSSFRVEFTGGSVERGYLKEYPSAKGYLAASRPDSIYLNIQNPLTSSTVVAMAADEGEFEIWVPRENKYLTGSTSVKLDHKDPLYSVRPDHVLQAILVDPVPVGDLRFRYFMEEEQDGFKKYYVIDVIELEGRDNSVCLSRKIWIERGGLSLARQRYYECGVPISLIEYGQPHETGQNLVSRTVTVERVREAYRLRLELGPESIRTDQTLKENAFHIPRPPGAELVVVESDS